MELDSAPKIGHLSIRAGAKLLILGLPGGTRTPDLLLRRYARNRAFMRVLGQFVQFLQALTA